MDESTVHRRAPWLLAAALLAPLFAMAVLPLHDTSEPRYAEIARLMAQTGDWVTPWFAPDVPFWGKPPLSFWAQALAVKCLGVSEFALRLPSWLCWLATNAALWAGVRRVHGARVALWTALVYATCVLTSVCAGAVLTDPFLALGTTLSLAAFAVTLHEDRPPIFWRYGFFLGLAVGLLAKGPLAVVLCTAPALAWAGLQRWRKHAALGRLPWVRGLLLCAAVSLPWYVLAEWKTPGFLHYFIVGEHFLRFVDAGWSGDLYGTAHREVAGTIWLYWLMAAFPWGALALVALLAAACRARLRLTLYALLRPVHQHPLSPLWLAAALCAPIFFTFSANILWTYVLPALAGFSVMMAQSIVACAPRVRHLRRVLHVTAAMVPTAVLILTASVGAQPDLGKTERGLVQHVAQVAPELPLIYWDDPPFSARFYTAGRVQGQSGAALTQMLASAPQHPFWLAVAHNRQRQIEARIGPLRVHYRNRRYMLLRLPQ